MTVLSYLFDTAVSGPARIVGKVEADVPIVGLDRTLFHPNTASQRADRGRIEAAQVLTAEINGTIVNHYVDLADVISVDDRVEMVVDHHWRRRQSTYHSAGHLIAHALQEIRSDCAALIRQHWRDQLVIMCYAIRPLDGAELEAVHTRMQSMTAADLPILEQDKPDAFHVTPGNLVPACYNGTHLATAGTLDQVHILRHEFDGEYLRLSYVAYRTQRHGQGQV